MSVGGLRRAAIRPPRGSAFWAGMWGGSEVGGRYGSRMLPREGLDDLAEVNTSLGPTAGSWMSTHDTRPRRP